MTLRRLHHEPAAAGTPQGGDSKALYTISKDLEGMALAEAPRWAKVALAAFTKANFLVKAHL